MKYSILHVIPYFAPAWGYGGPVKIAWNLAKKAVEKGHNVTVFTTTASGERNKVLVSGGENIEGIHVVRFANQSVSAARQNIWLPVRFLETLQKEIKLFNLICLHEYRTFLNVYTAKITKQYKVPYFLFAYGTLPRGNGWKKWAKMIFDNVWGKKILQKANYVFAQTDNERREYLSLGVSADRISPFPLMVDLEEFKHLPAKQTAREKFHLSSDDFVIIFLGRLHEYKGIDLLIEAIARLKTEIPHLKLLIVGRDEGSLSIIKHKICKKNLQNFIIIHPPLYEKDRLFAYCAADLFTLTPNFYEETSLAALEALACGIPIIVTKQAEIPYLEDFGCGSIIEYDLHELVEKLLYYFTDRQNLPTLGKKAKELIKQKYNLDNLYSQFEKQIKEYI